MKIIWRSDPGKGRRGLAAEILHTAMPEELPAVAIFDDLGYENHSNQLYADSQAFHMNIATGGIESNSPIHVLELMESGDYDHVFWFSKFYLDCPDLKFAWVLEHEAQHCRQGFFNSDLEPTIGLIRKIKNGSKFQFEIPAELDAENAAYYAVIRRFGDSERRR